MKIYLDVVMIVNFIIDFLLLLAVDIILRRRVGIYKIMSGAFLGGLSILVFFIDIYNLTIYKILISVLMILITFGYKNIKYFFKNFVYLYTISILLGGFFHFVTSQFSIPYNNFQQNITVLLIISPIVTYLYIKQGLWLKINYNNYYQVVIINKGKKYQLNGFLDTGNKLKAFNKPVTITNINIKSQNFFYIPYKVIDGKGMLKCIKVDEMIINKKIYKNATIGLINNKINIDGIDCLINAKIKEDLC